MLEKIKRNETVKLAVVMLLVTLLFITLQNVGVLRNATYAVAKAGMALIGYEEKVYVVTGKDPSPIAMMMGVNIEQEIELTNKILNHDEIMLEIKMANYKRINQGQLVLEIHQDDFKKVFVTDMAGITEDKKIRLIASTEGFKAGNIVVNMYSPEATGENCVAVYCINNTDIYKGLVVCGDETKTNACIDLMIPSDFAKSAFVEVVE